MVAQQTLTLYAWVRILVPLPKKTDHHSMVFFLSFGQWNCGFEPSSLLCKERVRKPRAERVELARKRQALVSSPKANTLVPLPKNDNLRQKVVVFTFSLFTLHFSLKPLVVFWQVISNSE